MIRKIIAIIISITITISLFVFVAGKLPLTYFWAILALGVASTLFYKNLDK